MNTSHVITLISDSNIEPLAGYLKNATLPAGFSVNVAAYGQVYQTLGHPVADGWANVVWTAPERILPRFHQAFQLEDVRHEDVLADVDDFADAILRAAESQYQFVVSWVLPPNYRGYGMLNWRSGLGLSHLLAKCNLRLAERLAARNNVFMLDAPYWINRVAEPQPAPMWFAAKVPYAPQVFERAASDIREAIQAIHGKSRRLIVLDLDNTLWGGVVGETGWEGIRLGGHDHTGEAFKEFQRELKALSNRGIQLALCSKNDESVALEAIDNHPEMILRRSDFAGWRINWNDKAANIVSLVEELNLGLGSVVFIDDNPAERSRVAEAVPDILVPEWPQTPMGYVPALRALNCFDSPAISAEDRDRKDMYVAERSRREIKSDVASDDQWLAKLGTCVRVSPVEPANLTRVTQLFNKTNQLNLSTRRLSETEITAWAAEPNHSMLTVSVSDQFGDMGLVGIIGVEADGQQGQLTDFLLSCRVMGRKVEETLIHLAAGELQSLGAEVMHVEYLPTKRNRPTLEVLQKAGLNEVAEHRFEVCLTAGYEKPTTVTLEELRTTHG